MPTSKSVIAPGLIQAFRETHYRVNDRKRGLKAALPVRQAMSTIR